MDKNEEAAAGKSKSSNRESGTSTWCAGGGSGNRTEHSRKRLQEPPKFYSKNYLKRYNHSEARRELRSPTPPTQHQLQQQQTPQTLPSNQTPGKKCSTQTDQTQTSARSQQKEVQSNPAVITISSTILKLADDDEVAITNERGESTTTTNTIAKQEINKNENSVNPYNRGQYASETSKYRQPNEPDYRYSLVSAMSSVKSSYFKCGTDCATTTSDEPTNEAQVRLAAEDESSCGELSRQANFWKIRNKVEEAIKRHKVFLLRGELPRLKEALEERGWIQKYEPCRTRSLPYGSSASLEAKSLGDLRLADGSLNERALTFALLRHAQPDFIWDCRNDFVEWDRSIAGNVLLNRFQKPSLYTSKLGMAHVLQEAHWLHETNVADVLFPRSYNPSRELAALTRDFRRSAGVAVLRCFIDRIRNADAQTSTTSTGMQRQTGDSGDRPNRKSAEQREGTCSFDQIEFAVKCCEEHIIELEHDDIDSEVDTEISEEEWRLFLDDCERLLYKNHGMAHLPKDNPERLEACYVAAQSVLEKLKSIDSQFDLNGERNIWIVKPSNLCCGSGIFMTHDLKTILRKVENKPRDYYVVQKYIERPFLLYGTKFDIRQWFLVTSTFPMTIWSFKEALLRLSSKSYTFETYHEAIHLCNTAVQERYDCERRRRRNRCAANANVNASEEPEELSVRDQGWDCHKLNEYLKSVGYDGEPYYEKIYPKMSQAIVLTMLAAQDFMDRRRCSFELYGADFMVMEDLSVWLIEINTNPRMHPPSSRITQRLYGSVLDSLVKVIMDLPVNPDVDTGGFELVYKQSVPEAQPYLGPCLFAFGKSMPVHETTLQQQQPQQQLKKNRVKDGSSGWDVERCANSFSPWAKQYRAWTAPPATERLREPKVVDFIAYLNTTPAAVGNSAVREQDEDSR